MNPFQNQILYLTYQEEHLTFYQYLMLIQGVTSLSLPLYIKHQTLMTRHMITRMWMTIIEWYLDRYADRSKLFLIILYTVHTCTCYMQK